MNASDLFDLANRCLSVAEECLDFRARSEIRDIARELIRKANELPNVRAALITSESEGCPLRLDS
jgi:hypothetical protein